MSVPSAAVTADNRAEGTGGEAGETAATGGGGVTPRIAGGGVTPGIAEVAATAGA
jgi:hypothetical protein